MKSLEDVIQKVQKLDTKTILDKNILKDVNQISGTLTNTWGSAEAEIVTNAINALNKILDNIAKQ